MTGVQTCALPICVGFAVGYGVSAALRWVGADKAFGKYVADNSRVIQKDLEDHPWLQYTVKRASTFLGGWQHFMDRSFGAVAEWNQDPTVTNPFVRMVSSAAGIIHGMFSPLVHDEGAMALFDPSAAPSASPSARLNDWNIKGVGDGVGNVAYAARMTPIWHGTMMDGATSAIGDQERVRRGE